jgi:ABC-type cobalamin transport system ATPase subunit
MATSLRVTNVWKSYSAGVRGCSARVWALRGCSFHVRAGERVAIAGRPGAGKSTLLQCIAGLRATDAGHVDSDFAKIIYATSLPLPIAPAGDGRNTLYLLDDLAVSDAHDMSPLLAATGRHAPTLIIAARHLTQVAPFVHQVFTLREGRLSVLPRTPVRRVAERLAHGAGAT